MRRSCLVLALVLWTGILTLAAAAAVPPSSREAGTPGPCGGYPYYDMGNPVLADIFVSPSGSDENDGSTAGTPLRTLMAAWARIPAGTLSGTGYRINLLPGTYPCEPGPEMENCQNSLWDRRGTFTFPIILRALNGQGTVTLRGGLDLANVSYFYLVDLDMVGGNPLPTNASGNNLLHLAGSDHVLFSGLRVEGPDCDSDACNNLQEVLKVNQVQYLYVENCDISGAWHTVVDYMVVQYGHFLDNRMRTAGQWGMYAKGGTSYLLVAGNEFRDSLLGFGAGQSANLAMMRPPWLHYEVYDIKFVNNILHDLPGVGMCVSGGYNVLLAYNTLYRVGTSTGTGFSMANFMLGERNCTPTDELPNPVPTCGANLALGGWGPNFQTDSLPGISNRNVLVYNNIFHNPAPGQTMYTHLEVNGPSALPSGFLNAPDPATTDDHLSFRGNVLWNGPAAGLPIFGSSDGGETGCQGSNPTCSEVQFVAENAFNTVEPQMVNPAGGDFRPTPGGNLFGVTAYAIPNFTWADAPLTPAVPPGDLSNAVTTDRAGNPRATVAPPGAYASSGGSCTLTCTATVPYSGKTGTAISFSATSTPSGCTGAITYAWTFGDGATSAEQNPSHIYASEGTFTWLLKTSIGDAICSHSGTILIYAPGTSLPGDCDGDGSVSIGEVQKAINMFLGVQAPSCGADCSGDGSISIGEVQKVINGFLGLPAAC